MQKISDLEYLKLSKLHKIGYKLACFFSGIPQKFVNLGKKIGNFFKRFGIWLVNDVKEIGTTFKNGDWKTRLSYFIFGFGSMARGQWLRGILFLLFELTFIFYMIFWGGEMLHKISLDPEVLTQPGEQWVGDDYIWVPGDNTFKVLLYGILTIIFIFAFIYTWRLNVKQNKIAEDIIKSGKKIKSNKDDLRSMIDDQFHKTLLALPTLGIVMFTALPILFMIMIAFTNMDGANNGRNNLFGWIGMDNFNQILAFGGDDNVFAVTFGEILAWTLMWAFFATFSNYFLGMAVAMIINKKGIKFKKVWRTILVMTIAIPQFVSLLYVSHLFDNDGAINGILLEWGWIENRIPFWTNKHWARALVILINIWIGIPYLMLIATGILMNIPEDLYESARIDGANAFQQYMKITLPYMLFVTGPYLLTSFIGNINNFNVIFLLSGGGPTNDNAAAAGGAAGYTDLLVTWLFKMTSYDSNYKRASVIGIMIFLVVAVISLIVYNLMPSTRNEEDFS